MTMARVLGIVLSLAVYATSARSAVGLFSLEELTERSPYVFVAEVSSLSYSKWKDEQGNDIVLARVTVIHSLKGNLGSAVIVAYKANVSDQEQMKAKERYVVFGVSPTAPLLMGHQVIALRLNGDIVQTGIIKGESETQSLQTLEEKIKRALRRG